VLSSRKWNTRYSIQRLHYEAERIVVDDDDSTEFFGQTRKIFHMLSVLPEIAHPVISANEMAHYVIDKSVLYPLSIRLAPNRKNLSKSLLSK
jgi:hypothetical protein